MNPLNEDEIKNIGPEEIEECIELEGERTPVATDERTLSDDINDYIFLKPRKKKRKISRAEPVRSEASGEDLMLARSNTENISSRRHRHKHKKKMRTWKKVVLGIVCALLALVLAFVGIAAYLIGNGGGQMVTGDYNIGAPEGVETQNGGQFVVYNGHTYQFNEKMTNILCMGIDRRELDETETGASGGQADVLVLVALNTETGRVSLINISRDLMTDVAVYSAGGTYVETAEQQICLSYAYGDGKETSCQNTVTSVKRLFYNVPIQSYFALDLDGIAAINDTVGGVDVVSPETIGEFKEGESYHLEGSQAEDFVRQRNTERVDSNNLRMTRQQTYLNSFMQSVISQTKQDIMTPVNLYNESAPYTCTNLTASKVSYLAMNVVTNGGVSMDEIKTVPGTVKAGNEYAEFYVDEASFYEIFLSVFYTLVA